MHYGIEEKGRIMVVKLDKGEMLLEALTEALKDAGVKHALVLQGIGMLEGFGLGFFDGEKHVTKIFEEPYELISLGGTVAQVEGEYSIHLHASLGAGDNTVIGGHLTDGRIGAIAEIMLKVLDELKLSRKHNPKTNLAELDIARG